MSMSTLVCFALKDEAAPFQKLIATRRTMTAAAVEVLIVGIGQENAEQSVRDYLAGHSGVTRVFTCGFAGGLDPELKVGDVVFETGEIAAAAAGGQWEALVKAGARPVKFFCADRIATTAAEKKRWRDETGADAIEMESAAIHAVCREQGIACVTVRAISDPAHEDLPLDFNQLAKPDKNLDFGKLAWAIAKSPGKIGALMQLQKKTASAARRLADVLAAVTGLNVEG
jgi:adenosylhomocysteine nucleosidase